jgi:two-component sensor histidine kinase
MIVEHVVTEHLVQLPNPDGSLLLRELSHRINNELTCAICAVSIKAVRSDNVAKAATPVRLRSYASPGAAHA